MEIVGIFAGIALMMPWRVQLPYLDSAFAGTQLRAAYSETLEQPLPADLKLLSERVGARLQ